MDSRHGIQVATDPPAIIVSRAGVRVLSRAGIASRHGIRVLTRVQILSRHGVRLSWSYLKSRAGIRALTLSPVISRHGVRTKTATSAAWVDLYVLGAETGKIYRTYGFRLLLHNLDSATVDDLTQYVDSWSITRSRNSASQWRVQLADPDRKFLPEGAEFSEKFCGDSFDGNYQLRRYLTLEVYSAGEVYNGYPWLLITDFDYKHGGDIGSATLTGTDLWELLQSENQNLDDIRHSDSHTALSGILQHYGIKSQQIEFTPYSLLSYRPKQGRPDSWVKDLIFWAQAEAKFRGSLFVAHDRTYHPTAPVTYKFQDIYDLKSIGIKISKRSIVNEVIIRRVSNVGIVLAEVNEIGPDALGMVEVSWSPAASKAWWDYEFVQSGYLDQPVWWNGGQVVSSGYYRSSGPVDALKMWYVPAMPWPDPAVMPQVRGKIRGTPVGEEPDPGFTITATNSLSIEKYGYKPASSVLESQVLSKSGDASRFGRLYLEEFLRLANISNWDGPLNPWVEPGMTINVEAGITGWNPGRNVLVEQKTDSGTKTEATMQMQCSKFPDGMV